MKTSMIVYRFFDVADEINLDLVQALWTSRNKIASRLRLDRVSTKSITFKDPPVLVELGSHEIEIAGKSYFVEIKARIFDFGVISLILNVCFEENVTKEEYLDMVMATEDMPEELIHEFLNAVIETIEPACANKRISDYEEDFVVYYFEDPIPEDWDIVPFLLKERAAVNEQTRATALENKFSYADDITYLAWDSAVVYDSTSNMDVPDLLEFANAQFLELCYYDNLLNEAIDKSYDEIEEASSQSRTTRLERYRIIRSNLMETMADVSTLTSNITNALQVTEDIFYAKIYTRYLSLSKASVWQNNIDKKLQVLQRSYNLLNEEVATYRLEKLMWYIVTLLILAIILITFLVFK